MQKSEQIQNIVFGPYELAGRNGQLLHHARPLPLSPKAVAVLWTLVTRAGQVVSKEELFGSVWPETVVSEGTITNCISELRRVLGDATSKPRYIETVSRRGYRFIAPLTTSAQPVSSSKFQVPSLPPPSASDVAREAIPSSQPGTWNLRPGTMLVGRETELAHLHNLFAKAVNGERQIVFVTGEAGIGKTALVETFIAGVRRQVTGNGRQEESQKSKVKSQKSKITDPRPLTPDSVFSAARSLLPDPWVSWGQCIEHYGTGEAYLPVLEAVGHLCRGPGGEHLLPLLERHAPSWLVQLPALLTTAKLEEVQRRVSGTTRERMLREMAEALEALSAERPLVLVLEDLHWSDVSTIDLLSMLARKREAAQLLILVTYRSTDVIVRDHPLRGVKQELVTRKLAVELPLPYLRPDAVQAYVAQHAGTLVDSLPEVGALLYERTEGHPLFMVQLLADLSQQAIPLAKARQIIPPGLQHLLVAQIERLTSAEQAVLEAGSVAGVEFGVASVAAGVGRSIEEIERLCEQFTQRGQFLVERAMLRWPDGTVSGRYGFRHALYQEVLYQRLSESRRARLHQLIGEQEEAAYGERAREMAAELAVHFERGHDVDRAMRYLHQAGENATKRSAYQEAVMLVTRALDLLPSRSEALAGAYQELCLRLALGRSLMLHKGYAASEVEQVYSQALALCHAETPPQLRFSVLSGLTTFWIARGEFVRARELAEQCLALACQMTSPPRQLQIQTLLGMICLYLGEPLRAHRYLEPGITLYETHSTQSDLAAVGAESLVSCLAYSAVACWALGYPAQASKRSAEALALARRYGRPSSLAPALHVACWVHRDRREVEATGRQVDALTTLCRDYEIPFWLAWGQTSQGWVLSEQGEVAEGIRLVEDSLAMLQAAGATGGLSDTLALLAEAYGKLEQFETGFALLIQALSCGTEKGECYYEAEIYRLRGELLLMQKSHR